MYGSELFSVDPGNLCDNKNKTISLQNLWYLWM